MASMLAASSNLACTTIRCASATPSSRTAAAIPLRQLPLPAVMASPCPLSVGLGASAVAASLFSSLASADSAVAAQEMMSLAADDNRGLALLLPLIPAVGWVLFNILQPGLKQLDRMRSAKALALGLGMGAASFLLMPSQADAEVMKMGVQEIGDLAEAAGSDSRGLLLLAALVPALGWVLFNILQPALNQLDRMKVSKGIATAIGLSAAAGLLLPLRSEAMQEISAIAVDAGSDSRGLLPLLVLAPAVGWVLFNILQPGLNQLDRMRSQK